MSIKAELDRLDEIINADASTDQQRVVAEEIWNRLLDEQIQAAWSRIENRGAEYTALVNQLAAVIDGITPNPLSTAIDTVDGILTDVQTLAE